MMKNKLESPININDNETRLTDEKINFKHKSTLFKLNIDNRNLQITPIHFGNRLILKTNTYELQNIHFHTPSEHAVGGNFYALEGHLVYQDKQSGLLVAGIFIEPGQSNHFLQALFMNQEKNIEQCSLNPNQLMPNTQTHYTYTGSLTTPPYTENVIWVVMKTPTQASAEQIDFFKSRITDFNARSVQPLNHRPVFKTTD